MTRILGLALAGLALAAAGCGGSSSSSSSSSAAPASTGSAAGATSSSGAPAITMQNIQFAPKSTTVKVGQKVTWTNNDSVDHNVTATGGETFKSNDFGQGKTYSFTPTKAGTIKYTCTLHPGMDGELIVK